MSYVNNLKVFVRVVELGSMSAAARDRRVSPAVVSSRIGELEKHLGVRLFNRTTRKLQPTEHGAIFYKGAVKILDTIEEAEAAVADVARNPRGSIFVAAPLGIGRRLIAPLIPEFKAAYPAVDVRLRLSDRKLDVMGEGLDIAFVLGTPQDSALRMRPVFECERVLCAAPSYLAEHGVPQSGRDLVDGRHSCLLLRFPGANEFQWTLTGPEGPLRYEPLFEVIDHLRSGALVPVCTATPPPPVQLACLYPHKRFQDPKIRLFIDFVTAGCQRALDALLAREAGEAVRG
eukprot:jgi/Tetstr1/431457/TSEL_002109.t1